MTVAPAPDGMVPHAAAPRELAKALGTDLRCGLSSAEAAARLRRHGRNELIAEAPVPAWRRFLAQFQDVLVVLLLVATAISAGLWLHRRDAALPYEAIAIFAVVLLNAAMGYVQETRAAAAVAALRALSANAASTIRDGERRRIAAAELVPGDLLLVEEGDTIPADARVVATTALTTGEAALTGESLPVHKSIDVVDADTGLGDRVNMVFTGTTATYGRGMAVVTATGMQTEMGRIAGMLTGATEEPTPLQRELDRTGKVIGLVVVGIAIVMSATIIVVGDVREAASIADVLIFGVALAVAAVPEGLPAIVTAVLAIGVQRMARRSAIVRHLAAVETLGSASVIASDKTGTLTKNEMMVRRLVTSSCGCSVGGSGYGPDGELAPDGGTFGDEARAEIDRLLTAADRANNADVTEQDGRWIVHGDPTEGALRVAAIKAGLRSADLAARLPRIGEVPFSSERKLMSTIHRDVRGGGNVVFAKGAPDVLLQRCTREVLGDGTRPLTEDRRREILHCNDLLARDALRTLGVAVREVPAEAFREGTPPDPSLEQELAFAGLIGMIDPPRPEAAAAVARASGAGIRSVLITGDHPTTAAIIAQELGISADGRAVTGAELERMDDAALVRTVAEVSVFARVDPLHKLRLVKALQANGAIVAMTGDGVNDAPALKTADIGIAMGVTGTDVSKEAADIVLADDNFATIVAAVEEGRAIFANIRKFLRFLLSSNIGEVATMFFGVLLASRIGLPSEHGTLVLPLIATQILWINLVTDGAPALALGVDPADASLMRKAPRARGERVITARMWRGIVLVGAIMAAGTLYVLDAALPGGFVEGRGTLVHGQTMAFTTLMLFQLFNVLNARSDEQSAFVRLFTNGWLWLAIALSIGLQLLVIHVPALQRAFGTVALGWSDWLRCVAVASSVLWLRELSKLATRALSRRGVE
ncbi:MAG TPA: cation-translocating P-type ATPase [Gemmatimonadaceae bacterium]|nr:cation-translocating P-type ATPase [Gemmatimonadaceae bacterium]